MAAMDGSDEADGRLSRGDKKKPPWLPTTPAMANMADRMVKVTER